MGILKKKFRKIQKLPTWLFWLPARLLQLIGHGLYRVRIVDPHDYIHQARGNVVVTWHNRLLFFPVLMPKVARQRTVAVVSPSRDGQYITDLISFLQVKSLRGSSKSRGAHAQLEAVRAIRNGYHVAFTPDGPRGPKYRMSRGPIHLAGVTGVGIIPLSVNASRYWEIKSWDRFQIPKPGATLTLVLGEMMQVPEAVDDNRLEEYREQLERRRMAITVDVPPKTS